MLSTALHYPYTDAEMDHAYTQLEGTLFNVRKDIGDDGNPSPKILVVAGVQGSGKTYMLNNTLLKQPRYSNYVRLYLENYRELHPRYNEMANEGVTHRYKHTETFIWELCSRVFKHAHENKFNIVLETALDTKAFATVIAGTDLADYQFDVHLIGCKKDFVHMSTIKRALDSLENETLERFVDIGSIEASIENAEVIFNAFETACMRVSGSQISMYERGFGMLKSRKLLCSSRCNKVQTLTPIAFINEDGTMVTLEEQTHRIERSELLPLACSFKSFAELTHGRVEDPNDRAEAWHQAYAALARMRAFWQQVPPRLPDTLWSYIKKYVD
ncbi:zeta toxin family protein [Pseudomonas huanghezhanensis]|uniref:zeta toxin family protein n=1 Tax=Pseudomonas huanghezhanensis TaxID=3002903 RepID=UPI002286C2FA|nr:zeta toxin family protein [Pseudomonas sp. BSw22131]